MVHVVVAMPFDARRIWSATQLTAVMTTEKNPEREVCNYGWLSKTYYLYRENLKDG